MSDQDAKSEPVPFSVGEHFLMTVTMGMIAERHKPGSPMYARLEAWAKENIPVLLRQGNEQGDLQKVLNNYRDWMAVVLSQKEADQQLMNKATGIADSKEAVNKALEVGDVKGAVEKRAFFLLKFDQWRDLKHPDIQRMIDMARETGDKALFVRLGRVLQSEPASIRDIEIDRLSCLLTMFWLKDQKGGAGLCRVTDEALTDFCNLAFGRHDLTLDNVRKVRQRLGLKKGPKPWFSHVEKQKDGIVIF